MKTLLAFLLSIFATQWAYAVTLAWDASTDENVVSYNLYSGPNSNRYTTNVNVGNFTTFTTPDPTPGETLFFVVTAVTGASLESLPSNEVSFTTSYVPPDATLSALAVSAGALNPAFNKGTIGYAVNAPNSDGSTSIVASASSSLSSIRINGATATTGQAAASMFLAVGPNNVFVTVTNGAVSLVYTIVITRAASGAADLVSLDTDSGETFAPAFTSSLVFRIWCSM